MTTTCLARPVGFEFDRMVVNLELEEPQLETGVAGD